MIKATSLIQPLSPEVISAIAAGEVIERPAVIVKELIENAIDAGATQIEIEISDEDDREIRVTDNGIGMTPVDLPIALERHTTSKLHSVEELSKIETLGFRGEALASIANVCYLTIHTKAEKSEVGTEYVAAFGQQISSKPMGLPAGTTFTISGIFGKLPARRKFLKKPATEFKAIMEYVINSALSHPDIEFSFIHNQKSVLQLPIVSLEQRIERILGQQLQNTLIPLHFSEGNFRLTGFIGTPQIARRTAQKQYLFINHRAISTQVLHHWVKESYGSLIEPRSEPFFILFLELPPNEIDINVHPRKEIVRFFDEAKVKELITKAIKAALAETDLTYQYQGIPSTTWQVRDSGNLGQPELTELAEPMNRKASSATESVLHQLVDPWKVMTEKPVILQLDFTYLVTVTKQGLILVDQHAAHERILYNQFLSALENEQQHPKIHQLPTPHMLKISVSEAEVLSEHLETLAGLGFEIEHFGQQTYKISAVPEIVSDRKIDQLMNEILGDLSENQTVKGVDSVAQRTVAYVACRSAVQAGDVLTEAQRQLLLEKLADTENSFTCPHGRPTTITFSIHDLEKLFKRR